VRALISFLRAQINRGFPELSEPNRWIYKASSVAYVVMVQRAWRGMRARRLVMRKKRELFGILSAIKGNGQGDRIAGGDSPDVIDMAAVEADDDVVENLENHVAWVQSIALAQRNLAAPAGQPQPPMSLSAMIVSAPSGNGSTSGSEEEESGSEEESSEEDDEDEEEEEESTNVSEMSEAPPKSAIASVAAGGKR
jgi:hypothetical protein